MNANNPRPTAGAAGTALLSACLGNRGARTASNGDSASLGAGFRKSAALACMLFGFALAASAAAQDAQFIPITGPDDLIYAGTAVNEDGTVVLGARYDPMGMRSRAFIWTRPTGVQFLAPDSAEFSLEQAGGLSSDGLVIAGSGRTAAGELTRAFRWTAEDGPYWLGCPCTFSHSEAFGISADGSVIAGVGRLLDGHEEAVRWTAEDGLVALGDLAGGSTTSEATAVSRDGQVIVGHSSSEASGNGGSEAFLWTEAGGMVGLGDLPGGEFWSRALAVSGNGSVVVGESDAVDDDRIASAAFRWTERDGMVALGSLSDDDTVSWASGVSADGKIIVGTDTQAGSEAFLWTEELGMRRLVDILEQGGAANIEGWSLGGANAISGNGKWVTGDGRGPDGKLQAYLARLPDSLFADGFEITPALNDAWYNDAQAGQGFFVTVLPQSKLVFLGWFTYDTERPPEDAVANLGDPGHRWLTAFGPYDGNRALLDIEKTTGGIFDSGTPKPEQDLDGTIELVFEGCNSATLSYDIPSINRSGVIPITRVVDENVAACEDASTR